MVDGHKIKKGATAAIFIYNIHRDESVFKEPECFRPERFMPENSDKIPPYAYIPFSAGRRNCIGQRFAMMEIKVLLANLLKTFEISSTQKIEDIKVSFEGVLRSQNPILFDIRLRKKNFI